TTRYVSVPAGKSSTSRIRTTPGVSGSARRISTARPLTRPSRSAVSTASGRSSSSASTTTTVERVMRKGACVDGWTTSGAGTTPQTSDTELLTTDGPPHRTYPTGAATSG